MLMIFVFQMKEENVTYSQVRMTCLQLWSDKTEKNMDLFFFCVLKKPDFLL